MDDDSNGKRVLLLLNSAAVGKCSSPFINQEINYALELQHKFYSIETVRSESEVMCEDIAASVMELRSPALRRCNGCKLQINGWKTVIELQLLISDYFS